MAEGDQPALQKTLAEVAVQLEELNKTTTQASAEARRAGAQVVKSGKIASILTFFRNRAKKKRDIQLHKETQDLRHQQLDEFDVEASARADQRTDFEFQTEHTQYIKHAVMDVRDVMEQMSGNQDEQLGNIEEALAEGVLATDIAKATVDAQTLAGSGGNWALEKGGFLDSIGTNITAIADDLSHIYLTGDNIQNVLANMLNLQLDDSAAAREAAREAARGAGGGPDTVPDAKADEAKAGGFFSKMGKAVMNPVGAMGKGMKSVGKGIQGFLVGLSTGLASFANPAVLIGVTVMSLSLPIFAAGLAAAFKVFEMIAGQGKALEFVTGIIKSLGTAIGTILKKVLEGFGNMVKNMGPFITTFFKGIATVIKALTPIVVALFKVIKDIITDPVLNKTIQVVLETVQVALQEIGKVVESVGKVIISVMENTSRILDSIFNGISKIIKTIGDTIGEIIDDIVSGVERLSVLDVGNLLVLTPALIGLAGSLMLFSVGAALAGAIMPSKEQLEGIAKSVERFGAIDSANLAPVGKGMIAIGAGLAIFGVGGKLAELLKPEGGTLDSVAKSVEMFGKIDSANLSPVGEGMKAIGIGLKEFGVGGFLATLLNDPEGLIGVAASVEKFGKIDATNFAMVGTGIESIGKGLKAFGVGGFLSSLAEGFGKWIGATDPVEKFQKFAAIGPGLKEAADGITGLAHAMNVLGDSNIANTAEALDDFLDKIDMRKLTAFSKATESLMTGKMLAQLQIEQNQVGGGKGSTIVVNNATTNQVNSSQPMVLPASGVSPSGGDVMNVRIIE